MDRGSTLLRPMACDIYAAAFRTRLDLPDSLPRYSSQTKSGGVDVARPERERFTSTE